MEISEGTLYFQFCFQQNASGPLEPWNSQTKPVFDGQQTFTIALSQSHRCTYESASSQLTSSVTTALYACLVTDTYMFTGKPYSSATGLYYNYQRWYDPETGRFISQDPILGSLSYPQTLNRYTYTVNNPVQYVDPTGEFPILAILLVAVIFAGVGLGATLSPDVARYTDPAMTALGLIPVLGDFTADPYFAARSTSSCALGLGCDQFQTGLDIAVLLPIVPGALARGKRIANLVDATVDLNKGVGRADLLRMIDRANFAPGKLASHLHHAGEMGFRNADDYIAGARALLRRGVEGQAELWRVGSRGRDLAAVVPGSGTFTILNTQTGFIRTFFTHSDGYAHIEKLRRTQGWVPFYVG